jgi:hypothetical protein
MLGYIPFDRVRVKHIYKLPESCDKYIKSKPDLLTNGHFWITKVENSIHYNAIDTNDFTLYNEYLTAAKNQLEHSEEKFKEILKEFDISKLGKITLFYFSHSNFAWTEDGFHRLCILKKLGYPGFPMENINLKFFPNAEDKIKDCLRKTTKESHNNGWHNRTEFGYHSFNIYNLHIKGQRNPKQRFDKIKRFYNFTNKKVLDLGCNSGGMLFHIPEISHGHGVDFDTPCIEACQELATFLPFSPIYTFEKADLNLYDIQNFSTNHFQPDIIFLLSLGSWVKNWKQLYTDCYNISKTILLEINNVTEGAPQLEHFFELGAKIQLVSNTSDDDCTGNHGRKTYLIEHH